MDHKFKIEFVSAIEAGSLLSRVHPSRSARLYSPRTTDRSRHRTPAPAPLPVPTRSGSGILLERLSDSLPP